ncbi:MAG: thioredoxin domain-containing protein [Solirubrobacteraceae bacterium]
MAAGLDSDGSRRRYAGRDLVCTAEPNRFPVAQTMHGRKRISRSPFPLLQVQVVKKPETKPWRGIHPYTTHPLKSAAEPLVQMASRREQKQQARQRRLVQEQARAERERRNRRLRTLGGVAVGVVVFVVVVIAIGSRGSAPTGLQTGNKQKATEKLIDAELAGIPQSGAQLGNPKAPITTIYYGDLECSVCAAFTTGQDGGALPQLISHQVKDGQVKIQYRSFCTATCSDAGQSLFKTQQVAALSAGRQHKFWYYTELFYQEQGAEGSGYVTQKFLNELAAQVPGLNISEWQADQKDPDLLAQVQADETDASAAGLQGTPTVLIEGPKGEQQVDAVTGTSSYSEIERAIEHVT